MTFVDQRYVFNSSSFIFETINQTELSTASFLKIWSWTLSEYRVAFFIASVKELKPALLDSLISN